MGAIPGLIFPLLQCVTLTSRISHHRAPVPLASSFVNSTVRLYEQSLSEAVEYQNSGLLSVLVPIT